MKTLNQMEIKSIVTSCRGSWQWQDAYRIAWYSPVLCKDGRVRWQSNGQSGKISSPQLRRQGCYDNPNYLSGSQHNTPVIRAEACRAIGVSRVRSIEGRGYVFA